ncbi:hypothetical protein BMS3Abin16_00979 [archaeon BMS3Abin16]|nr:hypothetical protein BMS3Abin16_00979 [archaeon BMS3Abin16]HDY74540.1 sulfotransferase [Euryarchaeota archaeon]
MKVVQRVLNLDYELAYDYLKDIYDYLPSLYGGFKNRKIFDDVTTYCMFIGYPRSGHSLIGALLDAHPEMIIAHELNTLRYILGMYNRNQIYHLLIKKSLLFALTGRKRGGGYDYNVPNQWQGTFKNLRIIGDKQGGGSTLITQTRPDILDKLRKVVGVKVKLIHVIRNPFDNITTISIRERQNNPVDRTCLKRNIDYFFTLCEVVSKTRNQVKESEFFELKHESFIKSPQSHLKGLCSFLGVEATKDYLDDCASIVYKSPHKSRFKVKWTPELIELVESKIDEYPFLKGCSYED